MGVGKPDKKAAKKAKLARQFANGKRMRAKHAEHYAQGAAPRLTLADRIRGITDDQG